MRKLQTNKLLPQKNLGKINNGISNTITPIDPVRGWNETTSLDGGEDHAANEETPRNLVIN